MAFDLGLHESCSELIAKGKIPPSEGFSRHLLFLGAYIYDKLWGLYLGRPSTIPNSYLTAAQRRSDEQVWQIPATLVAWVDLSDKISEVTEILNGQAPLDGQAFDRLNELDGKISTQCAALPDALILREDRISDLPSAAYGLHIQLRGIRIVLHRQLSRAILTPNSGNTPFGDAGRAEHSRSIMRENAVCIARLASVYQQIFGIENVITVMLDNIFVAAALLISYVLRKQQEASTSNSLADLLKAEEVVWIQRLASMLQDAQKHYPVTARMMSTLSALVDDTCLAGTFGSWANPTKKAQYAQQAFQPLLATSGVDTSFDHELNEHDFFLQSPFDFGNAHQDMDTANTMSWVLSPMG